MSLTDLRDGLLRPVMRAWVAATVDAVIAAIPRPADTPHAHADAASEDRARVLILGAGIAAGWGVLSHDLALPGYLARTLAASIGRGVDVDLVADVTMTARHAAPRLKTLSLWRYQAVVLVLGINESVSLVSAARWERELREAIITVRAEGGLDIPIIVAGVQPVRSVPLFNSLLGSIAERRATVLNRTTEKLAAAMPRVGYVPLSAAILPSGDRYRGSESYRTWAVEIAEVLVPELIGADAVDEGFRDEADRQAAVDALHLPSVPGAEFDRIVGIARRVFGTESAAFSVIDGDQQWYKSRAGVDIVRVPRDQAICSVTIETGTGLVVPDARVDPRFKKSMLVTADPGVRFYAGYPVTGPDGEPIGALCVFDSQPRRATDVDLAVLRHLAQLASDELESTAG